MSVFGRRNSKRPSRELVVHTPDDGGWSGTKRGPSRVWVVIKLTPDLREGHWRYGHNPATVQNTAIIECDTGIEAIQKLYRAEYDATDEDEYEKCNGRFVALDFYGGERVEALVFGAWKVDVKIAPPALGPP